MLGLYGLMVSFKEALMSKDKYKSAAMLMAIQAAMLGYSPGFSSNRLENGVDRRPNPWDTIHLTKQERAGKSYEELQELRMAKYNEAKESI